MATRFRADFATPNISPSFDAAWDITTNATRRTLSVNKLSSDTVEVVHTDSDSNQADVLDFQLVSAPLAAQTISSQSVTFVSRAIEDGKNNNLFTAISIRLVKSDGTDYGTVKEILALTLDGTEIDDGTATSRTMSATTTEQTAVDGDLLVVEVGVSGDPQGGGADHSHTLTMHGRSENDLNNSDSDTGSNRNGWIEFANDITFLSAGKMYLPTTAYTDNSPAFSSYWTNTNTDRNQLVFSKGTTADTELSYSIAEAAPEMFIQYVSPTLTADTWPKSPITLAMMTDEGTALNSILTMTARLVKSDGTDYGTPKTLISSLDGATDLSIATVSRTLTGWTTSQTITADDRLVVEIGVKDDVGGGSPSIWIGEDNGGDIPHWGDTTHLDGFIYLGWLPTESAGGTTHNESYAISGTGTLTLVKQAELTKAQSGTGTLGLIRELGLIKGQSATGTNAVTKEAQLTKAYSATGTNSLVTALLYTINGACSATGTAVYDLTVKLTKAIGGTGTATITKMAELTKAMAATGINTVTKMAELTKAIAATGTANLSTILTNIIEVVASATGTLGLTTVTQYFLTKMMSATGTVTRTLMAKLTKAMSATGTSSLTSSIQYAVTKAFSAVGTAVVTAVQLVLLNKAFSATGAVTKTAFVKLTKAIAGTGTATYSLLIQISKAFSAAGTLARTSTVQLTKAFSATGSLVATAVQLILREFAIAATGTASMAKTFIAAVVTAFSATGTNVLSTTTIIVKTLINAATGTATIVKEAKLTKAASALGTAAITKMAELTRAFSATGTTTGTPVVLNLVNKAFSAVGSLALSTSTILALGASIVTKMVRSIVKSIVRAINGPP